MSRRTLCVEEVPRLDVPRLLRSLDDSGKNQGRRFLKYGVPLHYRYDADIGQLTLSVARCPRWIFHVVKRTAAHRRAVACLSCARPVELLYWLPNTAQADLGLGTCSRCAQLRHLAGYLTGSRAHTGRIQPRLRLEVQAGNVRGVLAYMQISPEHWLRGRQALEDEGLIERMTTLPHGHTRRN